MKKIMMLGGNFFQMSAIKRAKELGYYVISVDYLPNNIGHKYSDEYHNISTIDKEAVLKLAQNLQIDGILSYASDVSAPTAAYVAESLELPTNPYNAVMCLTHKDLFRQFMKENNLRMPVSQKFTDRESARAFFMTMDLPAMIKPVDASGSKGVIKVSQRKDFDIAFDEAMHYSISKQILVEQFIAKQGYQIDGDGFVKDGKIAFFGVMDQHNHVPLSPHVPMGLSWPSIQKEDYQQEAYALIQDIFNRLGIRFGAFNFEYIIGEDGHIYLLEIGPRNGGNFIPDTIKYASGVDMIEASIKACVGDNYDDTLRIKHSGVATSYVIHSDRDGIFEKLIIDENIRDHVVQFGLFVEPGEQVFAYKNAGFGIGIALLKFEDVDIMNSMMDHMYDYIRVVVK